MRKLGILLILMTALWGCTHKEPSTAELYNGQSAKQIFAGGEQALAKGNYKEAIVHFDALDALYPFSEFEEQAQRDTIYAHYQVPDFAAASAAAVRYIHLYPRSDHVDYAYYMKGMANFNQDRGVIQRYIEVDLSKRDVGTARQSFADFAELIRRFPDSHYAADSKNRMVYLRNLMAQRDLNIAEFYLAQGSYVAAINRASGILTHYQRSPQVVEALGVMTKAYRRLGMRTMADQTLSILALNYPNTKVYLRLIRP